MEKHEADFKEAVNEVADAVVEDLKAGYDSDLEPFEAYAQRIRQEIHTNMDDFRQRFLRGYEVLLQELVASREIKGEDDDDIPPGAIQL